MLHLPFDRNVNGDAYHRALGLGAHERAIAYLERIARTFAEYRGEVLRQLGITRETLSEYYSERGMNERAQHFGELLGSERLHALQDRLAITAVGPVTAHALREAGVRRLVISADTTAAAVVEALEEHFAGTVKQASAGAKRE